MNTSRLQKLLLAMSSSNLSQIIISDPHSIFYFTNQWFETGERFLALLITDSDVPRLIYNSMFSAKNDSDIAMQPYNDFQDPLSILKKYTNTAAKIGVEKTLPARFLIPILHSNTSNNIINCSPIIDDIRSRKDKEEQALMRTASKINDLSMQEFFDLLHLGVSESHIASSLQEIYISFGADGLSFPPTVDFGSDAAISHHAFESTQLSLGNCCLLDVGCKKDHYCSDMTRTFFAGHISSQHKELYDLVLKANLEAEKMIRPGVPLCDIDKAARDIISNAGYGEFFTHRLGHFIGLEVHEYGDVSITNDHLAEEGNIFSIEPGIYIPGDVGIRIEDLVLVTDTGCEILNKYPKDLQII